MKVCSLFAIPRALGMLRGDLFLLKGLCACSYGQMLIIGTETHPIRTWEILTIVGKPMLALPQNHKGKVKF